VFTHLIDLLLNLFVYKHSRITEPQKRNLHSRLLLDCTCSIAATFCCSCENDFWYCAMISSVDVIVAFACAHVDRNSASSVESFCVVAESSTIRFCFSLARACQRSTSA
jgi:hypothetical protein